MKQTALKRKTPLRSHKRLNRISKKRLGTERFEALQRRANTPFKYGKVEKEEIRKVLEKLLDGINER